MVILHTTAQPIVQAVEQMPHPSLSSSELHNEEVLKGEPDDIIGHDELAKSCH